MATLQKLRDKGSLLVAFVGIALFAFIAGDIVKLFQKTTTEAVTVGSINGEEITYDEFYQFRNQCEKYYSFVYNKAVLNEGDQERVTEMAWNALVRSRILDSHTNQAGLAVTKEELDQFIMSINWAVWNNNMAMRNSNATMMPPVFLSENGAFNAELFNNSLRFVEEYKGQPMARETAQVFESCENAIAAWNYFKTSIKSDIAEQKLASLYRSGASTQNQAVAKSNFELDNSSYSIEVAAYPYRSLADSLANISDNEIADYYNANKELYKNYEDLYDVAYIRQEIRPSRADLENLEAKFAGYAESLRKEDADIKDIQFRSSSEINYDGFMWTEKSGRFSKAHLDEIKNYKSGQVGEPFQNWDNNTYNLVYVARKEMVPDSIKFRYIAIQSEMPELLKSTTDSLMAELNKKVEFDSIAKNYMSGTIEFKTDLFYTGDAGQIITASPEVQTLVYNAKVNAINAIEVNPNTKFIIQVMNKKGSVEAYDAFVIQRKMQISNETYNQKYNDFSQSVAACKNVNEFIQQHPGAEHCQLSASNANINGIAGTRELLRWVLRGNNGKISEILNYSDGNKKYLMVVAVKGVTPKGYVALDEVKSLIVNNLRNEKKGDLIASELKGKSFEELKNIKNVVFNEKPIPNVNYKKETFVSATGANEAVISAAVANMQEGEVSDPIKGDKAVYVVKVISKETKSKEFNATEENSYILGKDFNFAPGVDPIIEAIYQNANIENRIYEHM